MQNGYGNYGLTITKADNSKEYISIIGATSSWWREVPRFSDNWIIPTIVHEFCHSYINPLVDKNYEKLSTASENMYRNCQPEDYTSNRIMLYEYLVRASTIRYLSANNYLKAKSQIWKDKKRGFPAIEGLVELLEVYETNRDKYVTMSDFMPLVIDYFDTYAKTLD